MILLLTMLFKNYVDKMKSYDELYSLSDRELQDIGINRGDIPAIVERKYS